MLRRLAAAVAFTLLGAVAAAANSSATEPLVLDAPAQTITKVSTSAELDAADEILSGVGGVHVGVEATTLPAFGSTAVYLRTDPLAGPARRAGGNAIRGFPLTIRLSGSNIPSPSPLIDVGPNFTLEQPLFFIARVTLGPPGDYTLELLEHNGVVARTHLTATQDQAPRWQPLIGRGKSTLDPEPAVPIVDGTLPWPSFPTGRLPSAAPPSKPDPRFALAVKGNAYTIQNWPVANFFPEQQLLVAFYVNGKRFAPEVPTQWKETPDAYQLNNSPGSYTFTLDVDPATLGAKPSDKIEMELLCSPYGYQKLMSNKILRGGCLDPIVLSNRVVVRGPQP